MPTTHTRASEKPSARFFLWSIRHQDRIAHHLRMAVGLSLAMVAFMAVVGVISPEAALRWLFYGGLALSATIACLIVQRRAWLLGIQDPDLKARAYREMLAYLASKGRMPQQAHTRSQGEEKKEECTHCGT